MGARDHGPVENSAKRNGEQGVERDLVDWDSSATGDANVIIGIRDPGAPRSCAPSGGDSAFNDGSVHVDPPPSPSSSRVVITNTLRRVERGVLVVGGRTASELVVVIVVVVLKEVAAVGGRGPPKTVEEKALGADEFLEISLGHHAATGERKAEEGECAPKGSPRRGDGCRTGCTSSSPS